MKIYRITGTDLNPLYLLARSFDEALETARLENINYTTGQVVADCED